MQLANGLKYIHSNELTHRDVKPGNVLISVNSDDKTVTLKWADFGLSRPVSINGTFQTTSLKGTPNWWAPELLDQYVKLQSQSTSDQIELQGSVKSDIFALGLVFAYFLNDGKHPYGSHDTEIRLNIRSKKPTDVLSDERLLLNQ